MDNERASLIRRLLSDPDNENALIALGHVLERTGISGSLYSVYVHMFPEQDPYTKILFGIKELRCFLVDRIEKDIQFMSVSFSGFDQGLEQAFQLDDILPATEILSDLEGLRNVKLRDRAKQLSLDEIQMYCQRIEEYLNYQVGIYDVEGAGYLLFIDEINLITMDNTKPPRKKKGRKRKKGEAFNFWGDAI